MVLHRRKFFGLAAAALGCSTFSPATSALDYPTRPVHFIVSFAAGGPNDTIARILGHAPEGWADRKNHPAKTQRSPLVRQTEKDEPR